jgi:TonB family protein
MFKSAYKKIIKFHVLISMVVLFVGCASKGPTNNKGQALADIDQSFYQGDIRLTCELSCSGQWGSNRTLLKRLYDTQRWEQLAAEVTQIGYLSNLGYYYLGSAAEHLGYAKAARSYYILSDAAKACDKVFDLCDDLDVPALVNQALARLPNVDQNTLSSDNSIARTALANKAPDYPADAKRLGQQGVVHVKLLINSQGTPSNALIAKSSGYPLLDDSAVKTVLTWKFLPAKKDGQTIDSYVLVPVHYKLDPSK